MLRVSAIGFDWHPDSRELWGMDHGSDWRGDELPPEELNRIVHGAAQFGRPAGLAVAKDGALLVSDDENGIVYRIINE